MPSLTVDYDRSLTWYLICRTAVITFLLGGAAAFYLRGNLNNGIVYPLFVLIAVSYAEAIIAALLLQWSINKQVFAQVQIIWDLLFVTALILLSGGVESVFSFAYLLIIISSSFLLSRRLTVLSAAASVVLFGGLLDLQFFNYLESFGLFRSVPDRAFLSVLFVHSVAFFLVAILSGTLAHLWRKSEAQLLQKTVDLDQLETYNQTIVDHINSGLVLINVNGEIDSFNRAAREITGLEIGAVYRCKFSDVFPALIAESDLLTEPKNRSEGIFTKSDGTSLILGFAMTPVFAGKSQYTGTLVTFQDLTKLKKIEEELKRADRLAAVGRLAASMTHEIRNPLASISGAVQLLRENAHVGTEDRNLMDIVINEADRLSGLLTNFLTFARPQIPQKERVDIGAMLSEISVLLDADPRFDSVALEVNCSPETFFSIDAHQVQQVLWDLAINACQAMSGFGTLKIAAHKYAGSGRLVVEDNGPGIDDAIVGNIFDPFFSTREEGTGLGLASVYSMVEAHGGQVFVDRSELGGARFVIDFSE